MPRVDYDQIAHLYDEPIRDHPVDPHLLAFLEQRPDLAFGPVRVLDVGCGTGKQLVSNRAALPSAMLVGVDRFRGMLRIARQRGDGIGWAQGDGAHLPIRSSSVDYVTNQFSYHHVADRDSFVRQVHRVLRPGGRFVLTNIDPWSMTDWAIYRFFPEAREQDIRDCLPVESLESLLRSVGFGRVTVERKRWLQDENLAGALTYCSDRHRTSQLMVISDAAYAAGLDRIREAIASGGAAASVESEICLLTMTADKPSN